MTEKPYSRKTMIQANTQNQTSNFGNVEYVIFTSSLIKSTTSALVVGTPGFKTPGCKNPDCKTPSCKNHGCKTPSCNNPWL